MSITEKNITKVGYGRVEVVVGLVASVFALET